MLISDFSAGTSIAILKYLIRIHPQVAVMFTFEDYKVYKMPALLTKGVSNFKHSPRKVPAVIFVI